MGENKQIMNIYENQFGLIDFRKFGGSIHHIHILDILGPRWCLEGERFGAGGYIKNPS